MIDALPDRPVAHRGAVSNATGRYERERRQRDHDGWDLGPEDWTVAPRTTVTEDKSRSVIARNDSPDIPFDRSINPYRGCEHGCVYCFARPSHAWLGLSPGLDFESRLTSKPLAPALLRRELDRPGYVCRPLGMGTNTDPYQPIEGRYGITRGILEVLEACDHPVMITTKSAAILGDRDILTQMAARRLVHVGISVTTLDRDLARTLEPRASPPAARLAAIRALAEAGIPTTVMVAPMIPGLTDQELERILAAAADAGATGAATILLRLPQEVAPLFEEWLHAHVPQRATHVLSLIRQTRRGALNQAAFGQRMKGDGPYATLLMRRYHLACRRLGLTLPATESLDVTRFHPPKGQQLSLL